MHGNMTPSGGDLHRLLRLSTIGAVQHSPGSVGRASWLNPPRAAATRHRHPPMPRDRVLTPDACPVGGRIDRRRLVLAWSPPGVCRMLRHSRRCRCRPRRKYVVFHQHRVHPETADGALDLWSGERSSIPHRLVSAPSTGPRCLPRRQLGGAPSAEGGRATAATAVIAELMPLIPMAPMIAPSHRGTPPSSITAERLPTAANPPTASESSSASWVAKRAPPSDGDLGSPHRFHRARAEDEAAGGVDRQSPSIRASVLASRRRGTCLPV
jgi:hypothetical protein